MPTRPVFLNLFKIRFPIPAIASFLHRLTGLILFILIPLFLSLLQNILYFPYNSMQIKNSLAGGFTAKFFIWIALSALVYHLLAGIRHLIMDIGFAENLKPARISAFAVIGLSIIMSLLIGFSLC